MPPFAVPTRRAFLNSAAMAGLGAFWSGWQHAEAGTAARVSKARSVILIFNAGAPSHLDLWDLKPDAPTEVRGLFRPIATSAPGVRVGELLPHMARQMHHCAVVRTVHHTHTQHNAGMYWSIVGRPYRVDNTLINPSRGDYPSFGTLVGWLARRDGYSGALPPYVITPFPHCDSSVYITPGQFGGCLGGRCDPFVVNADPGSPTFRVASFAPAPELSAGRMRTRDALLTRLERPGGLSVAGGEDVAGNRRRALSLVESRDVQKAFDLSHEPASVRDRYGRHSWGQSHLLARRLVESGVRFVTTVNGPSITWDTHKDNFNQMKTHLVPPMDQAFAALLDDLDARGLLDTTLVVWMGDFGRTPLINKDAGRDHWPQCYSVVLAGGGVRGGTVIGESDRQAAYPKTYPVSPADIHASVFTALGYDPHTTMYQSPEGRPFPLSEGDVIRGLL
jgi:Protein of unknown function (DUF1501)